MRKGLEAAPVKRLRERLGVTADGDFGPGTETALRDFQSANGLTIDGIAGPDTFTAMGLHQLVLLRKGSRGAAVKKLHVGLRIGADGVFGSRTAPAVKTFQESHGLDGDGIAGLETLSKLDVFEEMTPEVAAQATVQPDEQHFEGAPAGTERQRRCCRCRH
ncbi:peptidoglycan-binding protein [uncultured Boseongicola sp.]|uniref:peptidoglycan-binding domain-containing protein n=1 Tax=uncultured Boseongicola sp. TaxID=1648499 RepID=UPI0026180300|nr:peptidoglycan-binding protein [uncultured Boseongicola sp.]